MPEILNRETTYADSKLFCERCGERLIRKRIEHRILPICPSCNHVAFDDPKVAAVVLAILDQKLVLVRRAIEPFLGHWSFPAGYVDRGEKVEDAAVREVMEETGLELQIDLLVGVYSEQGAPVVLVVYSGRIIGGAIEVGPETLQVGLFSPGRLPSLPFPHDSEILRDWLKLKVDSSC